MTKDLSTKLRQMAGLIELSQSAYINVSYLLEAADALDALQRDAERYRFIRDTAWDAVIADVIEMHRNRRWDVEIDAAMQRATTPAQPQASRIDDRPLSMSMFASRADFEAATSAQPSPKA